MWRSLKLGIERCFDYILMFAYGHVMHMILIVWEIKIYFSPLSNMKERTPYEFQYKT